MKLAAQVLGAEKLQKAFADQIKKIEKNPSVTVGYTANYAIYVHEMVGANFQRPGSQAKFLEQPLRELEDELVNIVRKAVANGATFLQGLYIAGLRLQRESQKLCPVDTGNLRASAFTRKV